MKRSIFGKSALDKISSIDQLDQTMTVVKPSSVLALISVGIMIAVAIVWGILGTVPDVVTRMVVLVNIDHITSVKYANSVAVKNIFIDNGDEVKNGQIIARIERQDLLDQIKVTERKLEGAFAHAGSHKVHELGRTRMQSMLSFIFLPRTERKSGRA